MGAVLANNCLFGFPSYAEPPLVFRKPAAFRAGEHEELLIEQESLEKEEGAFQSVDDWDKSIPLRFVNWFGVVKQHTDKPAVRGVGDLSAGVKSVNECSSRRGQLPARLASWIHITGRVMYLQRIWVGAVIVVFKLDCTRAFRMCPLALRCWWKTAYWLRGKYRHVSTRLTLGATCSVDSMAGDLSAMLDFAMIVFGIWAVSFVDDIMIVCREDEAMWCRAKLLDIMQIFRWLVNGPKLLTDGNPSTQATFLGVLICTESNTAAVTPKRFQKTQTLLRDWLDGVITPSAKRYMSLVGTLNFIACCIPHGRVFLSRLRRAAYDHPRAITDEVREDLSFWMHALTHCNGMATFSPSFAGMPVLHYSSDAAGAGFGCLCVEAEQYIAGCWSAEERGWFGIAQLEAAAIAFGAAAWGKLVAGGILVCHSDNIACVSMFETGRAYDNRLIRILRAVVLLQIVNKFLLRVLHLPGVRNGGSDGLSRQLGLHPQFSSFCQQVLSTDVRSLGGALHMSGALSPLLESQFLQQPAISISTAGSTATIPQIHMPWMTWNVPPPPAATSDVMAAFSTSPSGLPTV
jgi:hypothetical protein